MSVTSSFSPINGSKHVLVGPSASGINSRSELILQVDLGGVTNAQFSFKAKEFNDFDHPMPASFTGSSNSDGAALSVDGNTWYRIVSLTGTASHNVTQLHTYNLGEIAAKNGLTLTGNTMIKFQNYGASAAPNGGFAFDDINIAISGTVSGKLFVDANKDGIYQPGETLAAGQKIYLDSNNDGKLTVGSETLVFSQLLPAPIPDTKRSLYPLHVYGSGNPTVSEVKVKVTLTHTYAADIDMSLIAPDGRRVLRTSDNGGSGDNFTNVILDDEAAVAITAGSAPFTGSFRPEGVLSDFDGIDPNGVWTLTITDDAAGDTGLLLSWSLIMTLGERFDVTDANGEYSFDNVPTGGFAIRADKNSSIAWTVPTTGHYYAIMTYGGTMPGRDFGYYEDTQIPTASFQAVVPAGRNAPLGSINIVFSEPVTGVDLSDFQMTKGGVTIPMTGATITTLDNATWTIGNLAGLNNEHNSYSIKLNSLGSGIMDMAMNPMSPFLNPSESWFLDIVAPSIVSLYRADPEINGLGTVRWQYSFSEAVYGLAPENFQLTGTAAPGAQIISVIGGYIYANLFNNGTLGITMANSNGVGDSGGNPDSNLPFAGESYTITRPVVGQPIVQVNDGAAQRSRVSSLQVTFNAVPSFSTGSINALQLKRQSDGAVVPLTLQWNSNVVTLTFSGPLNQFGTLADGRYDLLFRGDQFANFDPNGDGNFNEDYVFQFHRLFGDGNGDGAVTAIDFNVFRLAYGQTGPSPFDFQDDNAVTATDFNEFRLRYGMTI